MNKWLKWFLVFIGSFIALFFIARITGVLVWYKMPTAANEPALKTGSTVLASSLKHPRRGNFIIFYNTYTDSVTSLGGDEMHGQLYVKRLCGMPGDIIEMKKDVLFVNNTNFDAPLNLDHSYYVRSLQLPLFEEGDIKEDEVMATSDTSSVITLSNLLFNKYKSKVDLRAYMNIDSNAWKNSAIIKAGLGWTIDNFGPLTVPKDSYFVLGDNRGNSLDSRYFGFIKKSDWKATILGK